MTANACVQIAWIGLTWMVVLQGVRASGEVVGFLKFDAFPGENMNFTDDSGKGLAGLLGYPLSPPLTTPGPSGKAGDNAVAFDGKGALAVGDPTEVLNILNPPLTLECWARATNNTGGFPALISYGVPGGPNRTSRGPGGYKLGVHTDGNIVFTLFGIWDVNSTVPYPFDGAWHHVASVYSVAEGGVFFYLDGQKVSFVEETRAMGNPGSNRHLDIGAQYTAIERWPGAIDRVRVSKAALKPEELDAEARVVKPVRDDTALYFSFDEGQPPYQGEGMTAPKVAISTAQWVVNDPPHESAGAPTLVTNTPSGTAGDFSLQFAGKEMAAVQDPQGALNLDSDWTLESWINLNSAAKGDRGVIFCYGDSGHGYSLSVNYALTNALEASTLGIADMPSDTAVVNVDDWQHVAVVHKKGASLTYFVNGKEAGSRSYTQGTIPVDVGRVLYIGAQWDGSLPFTGLIDRVRISNSALTAEQLDADAAHILATVSLAGLMQAYDGQPKPVTAVTLPPGLPIRVTYDDGPSPPVIPGSYHVVATVLDPNYSGSTQGILVIRIELKSAGAELVGNSFEVPLKTRPGFIYILQATRSLIKPIWTDAFTIVGDGTVRVLQDSAATSRNRFYRVVEKPQ